MDEHNIKDLLDVSLNTTIWQEKGSKDSITFHYSKSVLFTAVKEVLSFHTVNDSRLNSNEDTLPNKPLQCSTPQCRVSTSILQTERSSSESNPVSVCPIPETSVQLMVTKHAQHKDEDSNAPSNPINDLKQISTLSNQNKNEVIDPVTLAINCRKSDSEEEKTHILPMPSSLNIPNDTNYDVHVKKLKLHLIACALKKDETLHNFKALRMELYKAKLIRKVKHEKINAIYGTIVKKYGKCVSFAIEANNILNGLWHVIGTKQNPIPEEIVTLVTRIQKMASEATHIVKTSENIVSFLKSF